MYRSNEIKIFKIAFSAKSCTISEYWKQVNIEQKGTSSADQTSVGQYFPIFFSIFTYTWFGTSAD